jgi:hypothetical protein
VVKILLKSGADQNLLDARGMSALDFGLFIISVLQPFLNKYF